MGALALVSACGAGDSDPELSASGSSTTQQGSDTSQGTVAIPSSGTSGGSGSTSSSDTSGTGSGPTSSSTPTGGSPDTSTSTSGGAIPTPSGATSGAPESGSFTWPVALEPAEVPPSDAWKDAVAYWDDPFVTALEPGSFDSVGWVKFTILLQEPERVFFQDGERHPFHYDFAVEVLPLFAGLSRAEFQARTLYSEGREAVLGALLFPPRKDTNEFGVQFVGQDAMHPEMVRRLMDAVEASVNADRPLEPFYFPTFEQGPSVRALADSYARRGIAVSSVERWLEGDACYSTGWAMGRLREVAAADIDAAWREGRLGPGDILLIDEVPAELPPVAGIVSRTPAVPSSHVALLAQSFGVPFAFVRGEEDRARLVELVDREVVLRARGGQDLQRCGVRVEALGELDAATREALEALQVPRPIAVQPIRRAGHLAVSTAELGPADIDRYGGKAANFGMVYRAAPDHLPEPGPLAFSFDLWMDFMEQTLPNGRSLSEEIAHRLAPHTTWPPDMAALEMTLAGIRSLIRNETVFRAAQRDEVLSALDAFDTDRRIRFRSSSNVEDAEHFTGAGLHSSHSGCLGDELDPAATDFSHCNPERTSPQGVFRAIRRVFGSFYNRNAYLERLRHGIDEGEVGMAMLVHYADPDPTEMANGVILASRAGGSRSIRFVTQPGAHSVTNPSDNAQPEVVEVDVYSFGTYLWLRSWAELLPIGEHVLVWEEEYREVVDLVLAVMEEFEAAHPGRTRYTLDIEYKKLVPGRLVLRQVRELPMPGNAPERAPVLLPSGVELCTWQGEYGDVMANHRGKGEWNLSLRGALLEPGGLRESLIQDAEMFIYSGGREVRIEGPPSAWPGVEEGFAPDTTRDSWELAAAEGDRPTRWTLEALLPGLVSEEATPIVFADELGWTLELTHPDPQPTLQWDGPGTTSEETIRLGPCTQNRPPGSRHPERVQEAAWEGGLHIDMHFWWPPQPTGIVAGYTAPLHAWEEVRIEGLTSEPLVLSAWSALTYRPGHHNFDEYFQFEPRLDPGVPQTLLDELEAEGIVSLVLHWDSFSDQDRLWLVDGSGRMEEWGGAVPLRE